MHAPVLVTPPAATPVSESEAKAHLRVDHTDEDGLITSLVKAATAHLDGYSGILGRCMVTQTWRQDFDAFSGRTLRLPLPAAGITSVKVRSSAGTLSTVSSDDYALKQDALGSYVRFDDGYSYPSDLAQSNGILVEFVAGYGDATAVPDALKVAILLLVGHWFANREAAGASMSETPMAVDMLVAPYRRVGV
jgi:uncharacterized phiE125 gp8 family phage protein